jgi:hypothetical protein
MKNALKIGFLALSFGLFVVACGEGAKTGEAADSTATAASQAIDSTANAAQAQVGAIADSAHQTVDSIKAAADSAVKH